MLVSSGKSCISKIQLPVKLGSPPAVPVNRLLPVGRGVDHVRGFLFFEGFGILEGPHRHFGHHERLRLAVEPTIDGRYLRLARLNAYRYRRKLGDQQDSDHGGQREASPARQPAADLVKTNSCQHRDSQNGRDHETRRHANQVEDRKPVDEPPEAVWRPHSESHADGREQKVEARRIAAVRRKRFDPGFVPGDPPAEHPPDARDHDQNRRRAANRLDDAGGNDRRRGQTALRQGPCRHGFVGLVAVAVEHPFPFQSGLSGDMHVFQDDAVRPAVQANASRLSRQTTADVVDDQFIVDVQPRAIFGRDREEIRPRSDDAEIAVPRGAERLRWLIAPALQDLRR